MKKISFTFLLVCMIYVIAYPQKTTFGLKGAITTNYLLFVDEEFDYKNEYQKPGFYFGGVANIPLSKHVTLQPNLLLAMKGGNVEEMQITSWHIEVPVHLLYTNAGFFVGAGPDFSYGLSGTAKTDLEPDGEIDIYSKAEMPVYTFKRFEAGANILMGYNFTNGIALSANFTHGFNNLYDGDLSYKNKIHSKTFGFSVGYFFGTKKR